MNNQDSNLVPFRGGNKLEKQSNLSGSDIIDAYQSKVEKRTDFDLKAILSVISRRRWLVLTIISLFFIVSLLKTLSIAPSYQAEVTIKIDQQEDKVVNYDVYEQKQMDRNFYQTQINVLQSRALARRVIDELNLEAYYQNPQIKKPIVAEYFSKLKKAVKTEVSSLLGKEGKPSVEEENNSIIYEEEASIVDQADPSSQLGAPPIELRFLGGLTVVPVPRSNIVKVVYTSAEPELSANIANTLAESYIKLNLESRGESTIYAEKFLKDQLVIVRSKLEKSEKELVQYAKENLIIHTDDKSTIISSELQALSTAYMEANNALIAAENEYRQKNKISGNVRILDNEMIKELKQNKLVLETKYAELSQVYKPAYPQMVELRNQITHVEKQIKSERKAIKKDSADELQSAYLSAKGNAQQLKQRLDAKKEEILALRDKNIGYQALKREVETNRQLFDGLLQRVKEVGVASSAVSNNVAILDYAFVPFKQSSPNNARNVLIGLLLGIVVAIGFAFLLEELDDGVSNVADLESLTNLPIIGYFPFTKTAARHANPLLIYEKQFSPMSEAFRSTVFDLQFSTEHGTPKLLHITSSTPNEGKSCTSINLSTVFAQEGKRTLLIDCDLRKPSMHGYLDMHNEIGLTNVMVGQCSLEDAYQKSELIPNLTLLPAGVSPSNPVKLLASESMMDILEEVADKFDQVIIDSPPVLGMADALILSNRAHATLFVTSSESAKKAGVQDALKRLDRGYGNVIGILLTKVRSRHGNYYGYDGYYSYGSDSHSEMTPVRKKPEKLA